MKYEKLLTLLTEHHVDFAQIEGWSSNTCGIASQRRYTPAQLEKRRKEHLSVTVHNTAQGAGTRVYRPPHLSGPDAGMAGAGIERLPWLAALYSFARDPSGYKELHRALTVRSFRLAEKEGWPWQVTRCSVHTWTEPDPKTKAIRQMQAVKYSKDYYIEALGELVLDMQIHGGLFAQVPMLHLWCLGVDEETWTMLEPKRAALQGVYAGWLSQARRTIQQWICDDEASDPGNEEPAAA